MPNPYGPTARAARHQSELLGKLADRGMLPEADDPLLRLARSRGYELLPAAEADEQILAEHAKRWTPDEEETADNCCRWIHDHCTLVSDTGKGLLRFHLFDYQEQVIHAFFDHLQVIILKARQLGITETVAAYIVYRLRWPYRTAILLSRGEDAAGEMLSKARTCWDYLPTGQQVPVANARRTSTLELLNGSRILPQPATASAGRVWNAQYLVFDEWAHQLHQAQIFAGAAPTTSAGNQIIGLSSANGLGNEFARQWELAQNGEGMHPLFLPWHLRPGRDPAWYTQATRLMEPWQRAQEYPSTPEEAFILSGRPRFDALALLSIREHHTRTPLETVPLGQTAEGQPLGYCRIWEYPVAGRRYVVGADVAEGLIRGDYSAAVVLDFTTGLEVAELHGHWEPEVYAGHLHSLCAVYAGRGTGYPLLGVERNNHGHAVLLALRTLHHYPALYHHAEWDNTKHQDMPRPGWVTSTASKPLMIDTLAHAITEGRPYRNALFVAEALRYVIHDNGDTSASGEKDDPHAAHDDRVVAYAIAEMMRHTMPQGSATVDLQSVVGAVDPYGHTPVYDQPYMPQPEPGQGAYKAPPLPRERPGGPDPYGDLDINIYGDDKPFLDFWNMRDPWNRGR